MTFKEGTLVQKKQQYLKYDRGRYVGVGVVLEMNCQLCGNICFDNGYDMIPNEWTCAYWANEETIVCHLTENLEEATE